MSINAKLLASGLVLSLLGAGFGMMIDRSSEAVIEATESVYRDGLDPLSRVEAAAIRSDELANRFMATGSASNPNGIVSRAETAELLEGLSKVLSELRQVSVEGRPVASQLAELAYGLNRLKMSDGEITRRLLRREMSSIVADFNQAVQTMRADVETLREQSMARSAELRNFLFAGLASGFLTGALLLAYLARSIARSIRQATSNLIKMGGGDERQGSASGVDAIRQLEEAIQFIEVAMESRIEAAAEGRRETARHYEDELQRQRKRFDAALNNVPQAFCVLDDAGKVLSANNAFFQLFPDMRVGRIATEEASDPLLASLLSEPHLEFECRETEDGRCFELRRHVNTHVGGTIVILDDVSEQRAASQEMERLSGQDPLTGLANRARFQLSLDNILRDKADPKEVVVLSIDVEDFNNVNATLGQSAGDDLLRQLGHRFRALVPEDAMVARLDGDEFGILKVCGDDPEAKHRLARAVFENIEGKAIRVAGRPLAVGLAVGMVSVTRDDRLAGTDAHSVMQDCEIALQQAKALPNRKLKVYQPELREELRAKQNMVADLRLALERNEFELHFQPFVDLQKQAVSGFEALVRWQHPTRGLIPPGKFIPLMEEIGLIVPLGRFVLMEACRHAALWPANLALSVNLSPVQMKSPDLVATVKHALKTSGLLPRRLQLEVTESLFLDDAEGVLSTLQSLRKLGLVVSMDDFGTGYSSLGYLSRFPFDKIKIDQSFVRDMNRAENIAIVRAVMGLGAAMKMSVIAEGVETPEQLMQLEKEGCVEVQGYLFAKPRPASDLAKILMEVKDGFLNGRYRPNAEHRLAEAV